MSVSLLFHRVSMIAIAPIVWLLGTLSQVACAPLIAAEYVFLGIKKHWNDQ